MFRIFRRWGAAPRMELDPSFTLNPIGRWVGEFRGLGRAFSRCAVTLDIASSAGSFVGTGLVENPDSSPSIACALEGEDIHGSAQMLIWLHASDWKEPLIAHGEFDAARRSFTISWRSEYGESGALFLRRI